MSYVKGRKVLKTIKSGSRIWKEIGFKERAWQRKKPRWAFFRAPLPCWDEVELLHHLLLIHLLLVLPFSSSPSSSSGRGSSTSTILILLLHLLHLCHQFIQSCKMSSILHISNLLNQFLPQEVRVNCDKFNAWVKWTWDKWLPLGEKHWKFDETKLV